MFAKMVPLRKQTPISRVLLSVSFGAPVKESSLHVPQNGAPTETDAHFQSLT